MRRVHPLWRGFYLSLTLVAAIVLMKGGVDALAAYRLDRRGLVLMAMTAVGAFLAALPGRLRRRKEARSPRPRWQRCLARFVCGAALALGLGLAGEGRILASLMQGSTGAYAFVAAAWVSGFITVRIAERRRA
ncbi:MAG: hypothetical protein IJ438_13215 [Clostridia bacterium]|nr:hypothetical protein [Clostridia bacterium]